MKRHQKYVFVFSDDIQEYRGEFPESIATNSRDALCNIVMTLVMISMLSGGM